MAVFLSVFASTGLAQTQPVDMQQRAKEIQDMKWGMFICWSFSTFSGVEWTRDPLGPDFFQATGVDTDQWCQTAKEAGMKYILFLAKHHDGFCLWDTKTTDLKVTRSPVGVDVLAKLRESADKHGLKLALYFSEADWSLPDVWNPTRWPSDANRKDWRTPEFRHMGSGEMKKAQLEELLTQYGPVEFIWMDTAQGIGGLGHQETVAWVHKFQPDVFVGFNHEDKDGPAGQIELRERGAPGKVCGKSPYLDPDFPRNEYFAAEFTYPLLPGKGRGGRTDGADWFYSYPKYDRLAGDPERVYRDYLGALAYGNIFSLDVGPDYAGRIRDVDVEVLRQVGQWIRGGHELPPTGEDPLPVSDAPLAIARIAAPGALGGERSAQAIGDGMLHTYWAPEAGVRGPFEIEFHFDQPETIRRIVVHSGHCKLAGLTIEVKEGDQWRQIANRNRAMKASQFDLGKDVTGSNYRILLEGAVGGEARIHEVEFFAPR